MTTNNINSLQLLLDISTSIQNLNKKSEKKIGLSLVQWSLLQHLVDLPGVTALGLSKAVGVHPSTLSQTLKRLEKKDFIVIIEDPKDSRKKIISLTRFGNDKLKYASSKFQEEFKAIPLNNQNLSKLKLAVESITASAKK